MKRRQAWVAALWLAVVLFSSTAVWAVIRSAGSQVTDNSALPTTITPARSLSPAVGDAAHTERARPDKKHKKKRARPTPSADGSDGPSASPTATPAAPRSSRAPAPKPAGPQTVRRVWRSAPGEITVTCTGGTLAVRSASANNGWRVEVESRGPAEGKVKFEGGEDREVEVKSWCRGGDPQFSAHTSQHAESEHEDD